MAAPNRSWQCENSLLAHTQHFFSVTRRDYNAIHYEYQTILLNLAYASMHGASKLPHFDCTSEHPFARRSSAGS